MLLLLFSRSVLSDSLWAHGLPDARLPCQSPSPRVCSNLCPLSRWCYLTISSSVAHFSCPQPYPAAGSFPVSQLFTSGGQSIGASASASVLPMYTQGWFPLGLAGLISFLSKGLSRVFFNTTVWKHQFFGAQPYFWSNSHIRTWLLEKPQLWLYGPLSAKMSLLFNMMSRFVIAFLPRVKCLLISRLQSLSIVILEPKKIKSVKYYLLWFKNKNKNLTSCSEFWSLPLLYPHALLPETAQVKKNSFSMGTHTPSIFLPIRVKCRVLQYFQHCCLKADIYKFSFSAQYGILHMSSIITIYVFRESKDLFPSKSLLLAFSPSLQNCQEMNFNLEELLHLSLWIC